MEDQTRYAHSPAHLAVLQRDYVSLKSLISSLPRLANAGEVKTEAESLEAELRADTVSAVIDRRDVPGRETPLHLAVRMRDPIAAEILMAAGADWSLQNENGWSALQEAVCTKEESIAMIIATHYQPFAWAKWCRRLPRLVASAARMHDFYMEITFHFESSVIPFIGRIAPSDTYRIWKRGSNLRADMTLAGFDGFRIQRADQSFLFLGEGYTSLDGNISMPSGSLIVLTHKEKEITNALEGAGSQPSQVEVAHEVALMSRTNMYRPGIDVTQAELVPHLNWRRQERSEMVGGWKAKVYDMLHVMVSVKSRRVPGAMTDEELFAAEEEERALCAGDGYDDVLTVEERKQLESVLCEGGNADLQCEDEDHDCQSNGVVASEGNSVSKERRSWFGWRKGTKASSEDPNDSKSVKRHSKLALDGSSDKSDSLERSSSDLAKDDSMDPKKGKDKMSKKKTKAPNSESKLESEYKKGLRPVLWLTPEFPLKTDELLPLLDILANKVKAVRRLRELLTTKLPAGTFPVKLAIPIVPTIRVIVTFTKFEELHPMEEFSTPCSSPAHFQDAKVKESDSSTSWISWLRGNHGSQSNHGDSQRFKDDADPFLIPLDYTWVDADEKKRRMKARRAKSRKPKKQTAGARGSNGVHQGSEDVGS
ncbi:hypothetical protein MLD38_010765 [Melastoma candidum]|uniref:Uncharacterized protein n=1 Tax=Melastoma candidum TaxID=119954 RepID=A0ACB9R0Y6_9MYRT|nr:hypothetical protein MLD38_010765 [Melastoma candidum]